MQKFCSLMRIKSILFSLPVVLVFAVIFFIHPFGAKAAPKSDIVPDRYIVVLKDNQSDAPDKSDEIASSHGFKVQHKYSRVLRGFSASIPKEKLEEVKSDSRVLFVSEDHIVSIARRPRPTPSPRPSPTPSPTPTPSAQIVPTGISRIGINGTNKGTGIGVAIIDTGIDLTHPDLAPNIIANTSCTGSATGNDDNGHGSHVAGTIAAQDNSAGVVGVAPEAKLIAVKVLDANGSGTWSSVICGIDWVTANAATYNIKVANMSLGGGGTSDNNCGLTNNDALHHAICVSTQTAGVTYVVAAGNSSADSSTFVPAAYKDTLITVSALADSDGKPGGLGAFTGYGADDTFASFSNYGSGIDLGAPGVAIYSTYKNHTYATLSGTSMATPHVTGAAALFINSHPGSSWTQIRDGLKAAAEPAGSGHTNPSGLHPEPVLKVSSF